MAASEATDQFSVLDPDTGLPPLLPTTNDQYRYTFTAGFYTSLPDVYRTLAILTRDPKRNFNTDRPRHSNLDRDYYFKGIGYYEIPVSQVEATYDEDPYLTFRDNPGTTTDKYYHYYIKRPRDITIETDELQYPEKVHVYLRQATILMLSDEDYGSDVFERRIKGIMRELRNVLNEGAQGGVRRTRWNQQDLDLDGFNEGWMV